MTIKVNIQTILRTSSFRLRNGDVLYYLSISIKSQALAATNPAEVEKTIKSLGPLQVEYNGKLYGNGREIIVSKSNKNITIKGLSSDSFSWSLNGTSGTSNPIVFDIPIEKNSLPLVINQGERKVKVTLKTVADFNLDTYILADSKHGNRTAKPGETLYLVGHGDIKATVTGTAGDFKNTFTHPDLTWDITQYNSVVASGEGTNTWSKNLGSNVIGVDARYYNVIAEDGKDKKLSAKLHILDVDRNKVDIAAKMGPLLEVFNEINYWSGKFKAFGVPCSVSILQNFDRVLKNGQLSFSYQTYKEEKKGSRLYDNVDEFEFTATGLEIINLKCGKELTVKIPMTSKEIDIASANIGVTAGLEGGVNIKRTKTIETNEIAYKESNAYGGGYITPAITASLLGVKGIAELKSGVKLVYPYEGNKSQFAVYVYIDDFIGKVLISKDVSVFVTNDFSYEIFRLPTKWDKKYPININN